MSSTPAPSPLPQRGRLIIEDNNWTNNLANNTNFLEQHEVTIKNNDSTPKLKMIKHKTDEHESPLSTSYLDEQNIPKTTKSYKCDQCIYEAHRLYQLHKHIMTAHEVIKILWNPYPQVEQKNHCNIFPQFL